MSQKKENDTNSEDIGKNTRKNVLRQLISKIFKTQIALLILSGLIVIIGVIYPDRLGAFFVSFICGCLGGSLSLIKRLKDEKLETLSQLNASTFTTLMPFLYGGIFALIAYLLFVACILTGDGQGGLFTSNLFPRFSGLRCNVSSDDVLNMKSIIEIKPASIQDFAKLLVWCILAGYSEKFVDGILKTLEGRVK
ncbi:MAG: hypothetical protein ACR2QJ_08110 [Geminicoccaceae bacterium]